ncbi:MAG: hypothetical protein VX589_18370 [Myxococcota bacterium]|nr:hypothetical protein [Myxococcota bacterium]
MQRLTIALLAVAVGCLAMSNAEASPDARTPDAGLAHGGAVGIKTSSPTQKTAGVQRSTSAEVRGGRHTGTPPKARRKRRPAPCKIAARLCAQRDEKNRGKCRKSITKARQLFARANQQCHEIYRSLGGQRSARSKRTPVAAFLKDRRMLRRTAPICTKATRLAAKQKANDAIRALSKAQKMHRDGRGLCRRVVQRILVAQSNLDEATKTTPPQNMQNGGIHRNAASHKDDKPSAKSATQGEAGGGDNQEN